jgi:tetratricopeptide (TPR) repeat protein
MANSASVTWGPNARELFVNREELIRHFAAYLNEDPPKKTILWFTGEGGIGKSLLLDRLRDRYCSRLKPRDTHSPIRLDDPWRKLMRLEPKDFVRELEAAPVEPVPHAYLDFAPGPRDAFAVLQRLRTQLQETGSGRIQTPLFQYAAIHYVSHHLKRLNEEWCRNLFPEAHADLGAAIIDQLQGGAWLLGLIASPLGVSVPGGLAAGAILKGMWGVTAAHLKQTATRWMAKRNLAKEDLEKIQRLKEGELLEFLPVLFARDLNASMRQDGGPPRLVLLFDSHDKFWGSLRTTLSDYDVQSADAWLRTLIEHLEPESGIVVAISGQELPRWKLPSRPFDRQQVEYLGASDAGEYLGRAEVEPSWRPALAGMATVEERGVQPFYLGLLVDVYRLLGQSGQLDLAAFEREPETADKLTEAVRRLESAATPVLATAIRALSACLSFDRDVFFALGDRMRFAATRDVFDTLTGLSFVRRDESGEYRIHDLMRRQYREHDDVREAHQTLAAWYGRPEVMDAPGAIARRIYHRNQLEPETGVTEWIEVFDGALRRSDFDLCEALLKVREEMSVPGAFGSARIARFVGEYASRRSRHREAEAEFKQAVWLYDRELENTPDSIAARNSKGIAFASLADLEARQSRYQEALASYARAVAEFDAALHLAPDDTAVRNNKGEALQRRANLEARLSRHEQAFATYARAEAEYDAVLRLAPDDIEARNNKGTALQGQADLQARQSRHEEALADYARAVAAYDAALRLAPDYIYARNNRGTALARQADLEARQSRHQEALGGYARAVAEYDAVLRLAPDYIEARNNRGTALARQADLEARQSRDQEALAGYARAMAEFDVVLRLAPDDIYARINKGNALQIQADLQARQLRHQEALTSYARAVAEYDAALRLAPDYIEAYYSKGNALQRQANLEARLSEHQRALASYARAVAEYDAALRLAPDYIAARNNKGAALAREADLEVRLSRQEEALASYAQAVAEFDTALRLAPDDIGARNNKGHALQSQADLLVTLERYPEALSALQEAMLEYTHALGIAPLPKAYRGRCRAGLKLAALLLTTGHSEEVCSRLDDAQSDLDAWSANDPGSQEAISNMRTALRTLRERAGCDDRSSTAEPEPPA